MKIKVPVGNENKVKACQDCVYYCYNLKLAFTTKQPLCLKTAPIPEQDVISGYVSKVEHTKIKTCKEARENSEFCGTAGIYWEYKHTNEDYGFGI